MKSKDYQVEFKRYAGYVLLRQEVNEVLDWMDKELLGSRWLVGKWDCIRGAYKMKHTWIVRFRYGCSNELKIRNADGSWDAMPMSVWFSCCKRSKGALSDEDWKWVAKKRRELGLGASKATATTQGEAWQV